MRATGSTNATERARRRRRRVARRGIFQRWMDGCCGSKSLVATCDCSADFFFRILQSLFRPPGTIAWPALRHSRARRRRARRRTNARLDLGSDLPAAVPPRTRSAPRHRRPSRRCPLSSRPPASSPPRSSRLARRPPVASSPSTRWPPPSACSSHPRARLSAFPPAPSAACTGSGRDRTPRCRLSTSDVAAPSSFKPRPPLR